MSHGSLLQIAAGVVFYNDEARLEKCYFGILLILRRARSIIHVQEGECQRT